MDPFLFKTLHLVGAFALFTSLGAILLGDSGRKGASMLHGISLLLVLLMGFAMLGKPVLAAWWLIKLALWLFLGAAPVLAKRKLLPAPVVMGLCLVAAFLAAWLGLHRGF